MMTPVLSILIPLYNGEEFVRETLHSLLPQLPANPVELVLCDDASQDGTLEVIEPLIQNHPQIRLFKNPENLGMDRNFDRLVSLAKGEYIWFSGQDDVFTEGAVDKVLSVLKSDPAIDFIYMNFSQHGHDLSETLTKKMLPIDKDTRCETPTAFLTITHLDKLPSFLPAYILRRSCWDRVDKSPYLGTHYIQIGVLLDQLSTLRLYLIAHPYIQGRIPDNRWQKNLLSVLDTTSGDLQVITHIHQTHKTLFSPYAYRNHYLHRRWEIYGITKGVRRTHQPLPIKLCKRFFYLFSWPEAALICLAYRLPKKLAIAVLNIIRDSFAWYRPEKP